MEAQVAPSQQLAATQSQKPTQTTQPDDPANDPTVQVEADADEASDGEEEVRRAISASLPRSIARRGVSHPPRATPGAARAARARLFPRTAVPFLRLFPLLALLDRDSTSSSRSRSSASRSSRTAAYP